ncbi:MFS transporter [Protofrankia coriariae]|uniref:MFS transporter n=1 Tax=Protofrankia coriariae TaxID=1562887 RepID=A0ABR5F4N2_9ACTN|nr:MFS transporter [Protofrankia coriariae]KLL11671.1 MFS transporter [Protofrankia coriariae]
MAASPSGAPTTAGAAGPAPRGRPALVLTAIAVSQLMVVLDSSVVNIALPDIRFDLGFSPTGLSWVLNAYTLTFGGLLLLGGRAGDILGRRRVFLAGVWLFTLASLLAGLAPNAGVLVAARALQGVGAAVASPTALALITTNFAGPARARAIGVYGAVSGAGGVAGMIIGGVLTEWASWRWTMFVNVPIGVFVAALAAVHIRESDRASGRFDITGAMLSTLGVTVLTYALIRSSSDAWPEPLTLAAVGVLLLAAFVAVERRIEAPLTPLALFRNRNRVSANLLLLLLGGSIFAIFFFVTQFLQNILRLTPFQAGLAFVPWGVGIFAFSQLVSGLSARFGAKPVLITGAVATLTATVWLTRITEHSSYLAAVFGPMTLFGAGIGLQFALVTRIALAGVEPGIAGAAAGVLNVSQRLGGSIGLAILVAVFGAVTSGTAGTATDVVHGYRIAFYVGVGYTATALALAVLGLTGARKPAARPELAIEST